MFETHEEALLTSEFYSEEVLLEWRFVSQRFNSEWFYICQNFVQKGSEEVARRMLLVDDINEFKSLIRASNEMSWVEDVFLVTPGTVNGTGSWSIDLLIELKEVTPDPNFVNRNYIYEVDGQVGRYYSTEIDGVWESSKSTTIYNQKKIHNLNPTRIHWALSDDDGFRMAQILLAGISLHEGDYVEGAKWLTSKVWGLGGMRPIEMVDPVGFCRLIDFIGKLEHGSFT